MTSRWSSTTARRTAHRLRSPLIPWARLIEQPHLGVAVARNRGLAEARGSWITFLDQDDLWHPTRLLGLLHWLAEHPSQRFVATTEMAFSTLDETYGLSAADPLVGQLTKLRVPRAGPYQQLRTLDGVHGYELGRDLRPPHLAQGPDHRRSDHLSGRGQLLGPIRRRGKGARSDPRPCRD